MNQIFRITVGPETIHGRLPPCRVGRTYSSVFHIAGVAPDVAPPKIWITVKEQAPEPPAEPAAPQVLYWVGEWSAKLGLWEVKVNSDPTQVVGTTPYALTVGGGAGEPEYLIGQGTYVVYDNIAAGGGGVGGEPGNTLANAINELSDRVVELERKFADMGMLPLFNPTTAFDMDMRNQVQAITNVLRGTP